MNNDIIYNGDGETVPFAEFTLSDMRKSAGTITVPDKSGAIPPIDAKRAAILKMRSLGAGACAPSMYEAKLFYIQSEFMKNFEDDYEGTLCAPEEYTHGLRALSYEQLRMYYSWRTKIREGTVLPSCHAFAMLYLSELVSCIGFESCDQARAALIRFAQGYGKNDSELEYAAAHAIKDFYVYYSGRIEGSFAEAAREYGLMKYFPEIFAYGSGAEESFELFSAISKYDIRESAFYTTETEKIIKSTFFYLLTMFRKAFSACGETFEDVFFRPRINESLWTPFEKLLFYPAVRTDEACRRVTLSDREYYLCCKNKYLYKTATLTEHGRIILGCIMKETESLLRKKLKYKYKLSVSYDEKAESMLERFKSKGIELHSFIGDAIDSFYKQYTRKEVRVDGARLEAIRHDAEITTQRLIIDDGCETTQTAAPPALTDEIKAEAADGVTDEKEPQSSDLWSIFSGMLDSDETAVLYALVNGENAAKIAVGRGKMLEVLVDGINEKACESVGDLILGDDGAGFTVFEDYSDKLKEMLTR